MARDDETDHDRGNADRQAGPVHDRFFKRLMGESESLRAFLTEHLPEPVAGLLMPETARLVPGSFVDPTLSEHQSDLIYSVRLLSGENAFIYILIDHKSAPDPAAPLQLARYMTQLWDRVSRERKTGSLPHIVPLIVYHGVAPWTAPQYFGAMFRDQPEALASYVPDFAYELVDLGRIPDASLSANPRLRAFLTVLKHIQRPDFLDHARTILSSVGFLEAEDIVTILTYVMVRWRNHLDAKTIEGYVASMETGQKDAIMGDLIDTWVQKGIEEGIQKGIQKGIEKGIEKGIAEGRSDSLRRLLTRRFGPLPKAVEARIASADARRLEAWFDRAIDAPSLEAVFDDASTGD